MRHLILPDLHNKINIAEQILKEYTYDYAWLLGDYHDDFYDTAEEAYSVACWVKRKLDDPKLRLLLGNHDYHYWKPQLQKCSGYTDRKCNAIRTVLKDTDFERMLTHAWVDGFLLSHAGYSIKYVHPVKGLTPGVTMDWDRKMRDSHAANKLPEIFWAGQDRGGPHLHSGVIWQDWRTANKIDGVAQIVGHTPDRTWREYRGDYCIDTGLRCVGIIENGEFEVKYL